MKSTLKSVHYSYIHRSTYYLSSGTIIFTERDYLSKVVHFGDTFTKAILSNVIGEKSIVEVACWFITTRTFS